MRLSAFHHYFIMYKMSLRGVKIIVRCLRKCVVLAHSQFKITDSDNQLDHKHHLE